MEKKKNKEGWTWLSNSTKWHYFVDGKSLCGKFMLFSTSGLEQGNDNSQDNCMPCRRKLEERKSKLEKST